MRRALTPITLIGTALAMLLFAAACVCTSNGDVLSIEDYFAQLDAADQEAGEGFDAIAATQPQTIEDVQAAYPGLLDVVDTFAVKSTRIGTADAAGA